MNQRPELRAQLAQSTARGGLDLLVLNAGSGLARGVEFSVVHGDEKMSGFSAPNLGGVLRTGERVVIETRFAIGVDSPVLGVVVAQDSTGRDYSWAIDRPGDRPRRWRARWRRGRVTAAEAIDYHHPDVDLSRKSNVGGVIPKRYI
jgi:hypothetical protein